jgi:hypothetical protein
VLSEAQKQIAKIPPADRPSLYLARGPHGLESAVAGSIGSEVVDLIGARNVVGKEAGPHTIVDVSPKQTLAVLRAGRDVEACANLSSKYLIGYSDLAPFSKSISSCTSAQPLLGRPGALQRPSVVSV